MSHESRQPNNLVSIAAVFGMLAAFFSDRWEMNALVAFGLGFLGFFLLLAVLAVVVRLTEISAQLSQLTSQREGIYDEGRNAKTFRLTNGSEKRQSLPTAAT